MKLTYPPTPWKTVPRGDGLYEIDDSGYGTVGEIPDTGHGSDAGRFTKEEAEHIVQCVNEAEWISITDSLPDDALVLVCIATEGGNVVQTAWHKLPYGWSLVPKLFMDSITHWRPMPKPPKESQ